MLSGKHKGYDVSENPPWLHLLEPINLAWREKQILKGRDPDPYIEEQLRKDGVWPPGDDCDSDA